MPPLHSFPYPPNAGSAGPPPPPLLPQSAQDSTQPSPYFVAKTLGHTDPSDNAFLSNMSSPHDPYYHHYAQQQQHPQSQSYPPPIPGSSLESTAATFAAQTSPSPAFVAAVSPAPSVMSPASALPSMSAYNPTIPSGSTTTTTTTSASTTATTPPTSTTTTTATTDPPTTTEALPTSTSSPLPSSTTADSTKPQTSSPLPSQTNGNNNNNTPSTSQIKVLFAGNDNVCRSAAAVAVFRVLAYQKGVAPWFKADSCGTGGGISGANGLGGNGDWYREGGGNHNGNINKNVNERIRMAGGRRGLVIDGLSRLMTTEDLKDSVVIVVMDNLVLEEMKKASKVWGIKWEEKGVAEIRKVSEFCTRKEFRGRALPDPTLLFDDESYDHVLDLLEECCHGLLEYLVGRVSGPKAKIPEFRV